MKRRDVIKLPILAASSLLTSSAFGDVNISNAWSRTIFVDAPPFNGDLKLAYNSVPDYGMYAFYLGLNSYDFHGVLSNQSRNMKPNIAFIGSGVPVYDHNTDNFLSGTGTIINGPIFNQAQGIQIFNLGINVGDWYRINYANGVYTDGFVCADFGENSNIRFGNIKILASKYNPADPSSAKHCLLLQTGGDVFHYGTVECINGYHGYVDKIIRLNADDIIIRGHYGAGFICKSDETARCYDALIKSIKIGINGGEQSNGVMFEAQSQNTGNIKIGTISATNARFILQPAASSDRKITNVHIGRIEGYNISGDGNGEAIIFDQSCKNWQIDSHEIVNAAKGGINVKPNVEGFILGSGRVASSGGNGYTISSPISHGNLIATGNAGWGVLRNSGGSFNAQNIECSVNTLGGISSFPGVGFYFLNGWVDTRNTFKVTKFGRMVSISGEIRNGTKSLGDTWQPVAKITEMLPAGEEYLSAFGTNSDGRPEPIMAMIDASGVLQVYGTGNQSIMIININGKYISPGN